MSVDFSRIMLLKQIVNVWLLFQSTIHTYYNTCEPFYECIETCGHLFFKFPKNPRGI